MSVPLLSFPVVEETEYSDWDCPSESSELVGKKEKWKIRVSSEFIG